MQKINNQHGMHAHKCRIGHLSSDVASNDQLPAHLGMRTATYLCSIAKKMMIYQWWLLVSPQTWKTCPLHLLMITLAFSLLSKHACKGVFQ
jgi:hypothetical protein